MAHTLPPHRRLALRLWRRAFLGHTARHPWWGHPVGGASHQHAAAQVGAPLRQAAAQSAAAALAQAGSSASGLDAAEAARRLARLGPNTVATEAVPPWPLQLWAALRNPFSLLLLALALISWWTQDLRSAIVILTMVALSTGLRFVQERQSHRAAASLRALVSSHAAVLRPGQAPAEVPMATLVPGDVVHLAAGDMVPADGRVLSAKDLFVNQAAMTGEALPVEKTAALHAAPDKAAASTAPDTLGLDNLAFMGTNVVSGSATLLVLATGGQTFFGELAAHAGQAERPPTQFQAGINQVSWLLIRFMAVMVPLVLLINGFGKGDWLQAFLFALSVAVGLTPEMLPMIVTSTLAKGALAMAKRRVIVKRLDAIQNIGAMDVLCTDKTGTLTQDRIVLGRSTDVHGAPSEEVRRLAWLNSHYQTGLRNLMDQAVLAHTELAPEAARWQLIDEVPFDFQRRRMSVVLRANDPPDEAVLICKGAVEEVLAACTQVQDGPDLQPLDAERAAALQTIATRLNGEGLRVVAVATRMLPPGEAPRAFHAADECALTLRGFVAFLDPPKDSTAPALAALAAHGVAVKVLTGDNEAVSRTVCAQVGLTLDDGPLDGVRQDGVRQDGVRQDGVLLGPQIAAMDDATLQAAVAHTTLFAKLAPQDKARIVTALRAGGHVVGFMGDGINDAPALHAADIGISVDSAVDIAKEVADVILLEKSLMVLAEGVVEGRKTFANMLKYIQMTASSNFGNVLSVLVASVALPFLPMLPMHLLVQNLLYDFSQVPIPFDAVDPEQVAAPQRWHPAELGRFMLYFGPISSVFDGLTFALLWWGLGAQTEAQQTLFQSGWFIEGLLTQTLVVHLIRTARIPFLQSRAAPALLATTAVLAVVAVWLPMGPLAPWLKLQPLPGLYFAVLPLLLIGYMVCVQAMKQVWLRHHSWGGVPPPAAQRPVQLA